MTDDQTPSQPATTESTAPSPSQPAQAPLETAVSKAFVGPDGIRALWRLLIFIAIVAGLGVVVVGIVALVNHGKPPQSAFTPSVTILSEGITFLVALLASWIMSKIERRKVADYGLPARDAFRGKFWAGAVIGFGSITLLLVALRLAHVFYFGTIGLHGAAIAKYAVLWGAAFLFVSLFEEFFFRGYALFTITTGTTFWPAAILCSAVFGFVHHSNAGESWLGACNAGAVGLLFCLILRRTGNLWMAIGFHAAWDWGETYFYGVADSGIVAPGHLFDSKLAPQPAWLSGGTVGPEGSWLCLALIVILWIAFASLLREAKYPDPGALANPRRKPEAPLSILAPEP
ncbi:MAG TPA: CPBP family intramembrane glutamic endopeptidase [Candidatus Acidoferrum sp.]|nr:CPBP family intramembrane glutamic endopeptidase [Candidatus Acidoferrum sp.]